MGTMCTCTGVLALFTMDGMYVIRLRLIITYHWHMCDTTDCLPLHEFETLCRSIRDVLSGPGVI